MYVVTWLCVTRQKQNPRIVSLWALKLSEWLPGSAALWELHTLQENENRSLKQDFFTCEAYVLSDDLGFVVGVFLGVFFACEIANLGK